MSAETPTRHPDTPEARSPISGPATGQRTTGNPHPRPDSGIGTVAERRERYLADVPPLYRGQAGRAFTGASRATCVRVKCLDCCNYQRMEVRHCQVILCPLHPIRPYQPGEDDTGGEE